MFIFYSLNHYFSFVDAAMPNYGQPPQYTAEAYGKQAAYNPNYGQ